VGRKGENEKKGERKKKVGVIYGGRKERKRKGSGIDKK